MSEAHLQFSTGGYQIFHIRPATIQNGLRCVVGAAYDGTVVCHTFSGELVWKSRAGNHFPFSLAVGDIDGDGLDEVFVASADGSLYAFDHDGRELRKVSQTAPMVSVCVVQHPDGPRVLAGGVEQILYSIDASGNIVEKKRLAGIVKYIEPGVFDKSGTQGAAVVIVKSCRGNDQAVFLNLFAPDTLQATWEEDLVVPYGLRTTRDHEIESDTAVFMHPKVFSLLTCDINADGRDEILLSRGFEEPGKIFAFDAEKNQLDWNFKPPRKFKWRYRMNLLSADIAGVTGEKGVIGLFGNDLILYNMDGSCREMISMPYALNDGYFDAASGCYLMGSNQSSGDEVHVVDMKAANWRESLQSYKPVGKIKTIIDNLKRLDDRMSEIQPENFVRHSRPCIITSLKPEQVRALKEKIDCPSIDITSFHTLTENVPPGWSRDRRMPFDLSRKQIVDFATDMERDGNLFVLWGGHGGSFYMTLETFEEVLQAAPVTCRGFVFAEMHPRSPHTPELIEKKMKPLAELCAKYGEKKIILRNQRLFWNTACYTEAWSNLFFDPKYRNIFVPSMEETHCRTQDISLSGRVGLWLAGKFDHHSGRAVSDNATFSRLWEWSAQDVPHHHLRAMALHAVLGADIFLVSLVSNMYEDFMVFAKMLEKGILRIPQRENLLSVSNVCLGMRPPADKFYAHAENSHRFIDYCGEDDPMVFDRLEWYWGGAPLGEDDFCRFGFGSESRMLHYLPRMPHGFVASVPADAHVSSCKIKVETDGEFYYDAEGERRTATEYRPKVENALLEAAKSLPIRVEGDVAWSAVRIDASTVRVTVLDSGYLDPAPRHARIIVQGLKAHGALDLLTGEQLLMEGNVIEVDVPAASMSIVDITHG